MLNQKFARHAVAHIAPAVFTALFLAACGSYSKNGNTLSTNPGAPTSSSSTIPAAPAGVAASASNSQISISWNASSGATAYNVKRSNASVGPYNTVAAPTVAGYVDHSVANSTRYFYVVSALNSAGESSNSVPVSATTAATNTSDPPPGNTAESQSVPSAPANLAAAAGNAQVSLTWSASTGATGYELKRSTNSSGPFGIIASPTAASYLDKSVTNSTRYFYVVAAINSAGESPNSSSANATPEASAPSSPSTSSSPAPPATAKPNVTITVNPANRHSISPFIYGINHYEGITDAPANLTFDRAGGDRWTAYNWETNASNSGNDADFDNDAYLSNSKTPADAVRAFISFDQANKMATLMTVPMQGLAAADENGPVSLAHPPDMSRFKTVVDRKLTKSTTPFTLTPPTSDSNVYVDEMLWALDQKFSGQSIFGSHPTSHPVFIDLDNEPELWNTTHPEVQGYGPVTSDNLIAKTITITEAIKAQFPNVVIFGPVNYGFGGIYNWAGEFSINNPDAYDWFADKYITAMAKASASYGKRLVDVYDFHWYSFVTDPEGNRITNLTGPTLTQAQITAIVQSPRSLWDTSYIENSWITGKLNEPINILGRLQTRINNENPGMRIAISEYNNGGGQHIAGAIAQADNLGIFGVQSVFAASLWRLTTNSEYILAGFRAFRDFDGNNSNFGDTSLQASSSNVANVAAYASTDSTNADRAVFVLINRSNSSQITAINGISLHGTAHLFQITAATAASQSSITPVSAGTLATSGSTLTLTLPAMSITTVDVY
jgi:Glycoside hydrolase family 44